MNHQTNTDIKPMRVIARATAVTLAIMSCEPLLGLINNYEQTVLVEWWKIILGPFAWYFVEFSGKGASPGQLHWVALFSLAGILSLIMFNSRTTRILTRIGIVLWFLAGLSLVLAWA
jgi:hypothetical protein